jgi:tetratricopeptide (TPR) repeat protein
MPDLPHKQNSRKRIFLFRAIALFSPFVLLILLELLLRLFQYGNNLDLFIEDKGNPDYYVFNPAASKKYFSNQAIATTGNSELFKKEKDENTLRIFVLGESTTIGYPYFHNGSFHRWLEYRLMHSFPDRKFEVINCSLTAVNSYTVLGFAKEVVNYQPDVVLIYSGHNEYYGVMGVGSTDNIGGNQFIIKLILYLRQFRIVQGMTNIYNRLVHAVRDEDKTTGATRMELMVKDQKIPYGSDLYQRGIRQFAGNLDQILQIFNHRHIPVLLSNLVSNAKDLKPFTSIEPDSSRFPGFKENFSSGMKAFDDQNFVEASRFLTAANQIYPYYALSYFTLGSIAYQQAKYDSAKKFYQTARDLDGLRFRAPGEMNEIISRLATKYDNVILVDTRTVFEDHSPGRIIGGELILEHVHPNLEGYALMSDAFYQALKKTGLIQIGHADELSFSQLQRDMPLTKVDSLAAVYRIENLKRSWPFSESMTADTVVIRSEEEKIAYALANKKIDWFDAMNKLYNDYIDRNKLIEAKTVVEGLTLEYPEDPAYALKTGTLYGKLEDFPKAAFYLKQAFDISASPEQAKTLLILYLKMDRPAEAIRYIDYVSQNQMNGSMQGLKQYSEQIITLERNYYKDSTNIPNLNEIAQKYIQMGNKDAAVKYIDKILRLDPGNKEALGLRQSLKN